MVEIPRRKLLGMTTVVFGFFTNVSEDDCRKLSGDLQPFGNGPRIRVRGDEPLKETAG
jgi:hypothetical protein